MTDRSDRSRDEPRDEWDVLAVPVDEPPPAEVATEEDQRATALADQSVLDDGSPPGPPPAGPPGARIFSLEGRPAPSLYLIGWLGSAAGLAILAVALLSGSPAVAPLIALIGICVLTIGLSVAAGYQLVARAGRPAYAYRGPSPLILFGVVLGLSTVLSLALGPLGLRSDEPAGFLIALGVVAATYLIVVGLFLVRTGVLRWSDMGWLGWPVGSRYGPGRLLGDVAYAVALMVPTLLLALILAAILSQLLGVLPTQILPEAVTGGDRLLILVAAAILAPIAEELFFRGFALTAWLRDLGPRGALIRASLFFAIVHIANVDVEPGQAGMGLAQALIQFAVILPVGTVLGVLFLQRGMVAAIAGHMAYNGLGLLLYLAGRAASGAG
ncbi:MAG: CPBP family intramembrane metalloprotease [Chloroflexota bacterium]|nr:CPBP family intramembrane metalloprotease [Chloroflexota bacterium]